MFFMIFDVFGHFEAGNKIGTGPANYTDVKRYPDLEKEARDPGPMGLNGENSPWG